MSSTIFLCKVKWSTVFLVVLVLSLSLGSCTEEKIVKQNYVVGIINMNPNLDKVVRSCQKELVEHNFFKDKHLTFLYGGALKNIQEIKPRVLEFKKRKVDLVYTLTTPVTKIAKKVLAESSIPIVFGPVFSPKEQGIVRSNMKPGGNITGVKVRGATQKAVEWLLHAAPHVKTLWIPFHHTDKAAIKSVDDLKKIAKDRNISLVLAKINNEQELLYELSTIPATVDAVWVTQSHLIVSNVQKVITAASKRKLPVGSTTSVSNGVVVGFTARPEAIGKQAGRMAAKILMGVPAADIPVENAEHFLGINLRTAKKIDMKIPDDILHQANIIIR